MKARAALFIVFTLTLFAMGVLITTLFNTAPSTRDALPLFYVSALIFLFGLVFLSSFAFYWFRHRVIPVGLTLNLIIRLSIVTDLFVLALLALEASNVLSWATSLVLLVAAIIGMFIFRKKIA